MHPNIYTILQSKLKVIKSWPFIYWISDEFRQKFSGDSIEDRYNVSQGLATANNLRFLRYHWEVCNPDKWVRYAKGGPFNKWFGNIWLMVNWQRNGHEIKNFKDEKGKVRSRAQNEQYYFRQGITYSATSSKGVSFRILEEMHIFDVKGSSVFSKNMKDSDYLICSILNSKLADYIISCLNSTVETQVGDIKRIPIPTIRIEDSKELESLVEICVRIKRHISSYRIVEPDYKKCAIDQFRSSHFGSAFVSIFGYENHLSTQILINEAKINQKIFDIYDLTEQDKSMVLSKEGKSIGALPVLIEAREAYLKNPKRLRNSRWKPFMTSLLHCQLSSFLPKSVKLLKMGLT